MNRHELKTIQPYFEQVWENNKRFECRLNDRNFKENDIVKLKEYDPKSGTYSGREVLARVGYVLTDEFTGVAKGYCVFSLHNPINFNNGR